MTSTAGYDFTARRWAIFPAVASILLAAFVLIGLKNFDLTYQAWDLWKEGETPLSAFSQGHPHSMRYVVYYPLFLIANGLGASVDVVFGLFCAGLFALLVTALTGIERGLSRPAPWRVAAYTLLFFALVMVMNGRLLIAFGGYAVAIWAFVASLRSGWRPVHSIGLILGLLLTSISSGTLVVTTIYAMAATVYILWRVRPPVSGRALLVGTLLLVGLLFSSTLWIGFFKNVDYFGGGLTGFIGMLDHGLGRFFIKFGTLGIVAAVGIAVVGLALAYAIGRTLAPANLLVMLAILPAAVGGLFGISTLAVGLVPVVLLVRPETLTAVWPRAGALA